jgi:hypothetical protein
MLDSAAIGEQLSLAYVRAVASSCGFAVEHRTIDRDGVDLSVHAKGKLLPESRLLSPAIHLQAKASINAVRVGDWVRYDLEAKNYKLLTGTYGEPRYLLLLQLPQDNNDWLSWSAEELVLRRTAWWASFSGAPEISNTSTTRVWIPSSQVFSPASVRNLLELASRQVLVPFTARESTDE